MGETIGPVADVVIQPQYLDIALPKGQRYVHPTEVGHKVFAYVFEGTIDFNDGTGSSTGSVIGPGQLALFSDGREVSATAVDAESHYLLISGRPIGEPIAWRGPIVMNTDEELKTAFEEYRNGTFIR